MNDLSRELSKKNEGLQPKALPKKIPAHYQLDSLIPSLRIPPTPNLIRSPHAPITLCKAKTEFLGPIFHFPDLAHVHFMGSASRPEPLLDKSWHHFTSFKPPSPGSSPAGLGASSVLHKGGTVSSPAEQKDSLPTPTPSSALVGFSSSWFRAALEKGRNLTSLRWSLKLEKPTFLSEPNDF